MNSPTAPSAKISQLIAELQSADDAVRGAAWQNAATLGAPAVKPLASLMAHPDFEIARAATRALWKIVRQAGRPKATRDRRAVQEELISLLETAPNTARGEALWMLSEIGDATAIKPIARLLADPELREPARCALERIPGHAATRALHQALQSSPEDFRYALANSLRVRRRTVNGYPSQKLLPRKPTGVPPK